METPVAEEPEDDDGFSEEEAKAYDERVGQLMEDLSNDFPW